MVVIKKTLTAAPVETPVLRSSTNYMETLQQVEPVSGGSGVNAFLNDSGKLDIYAIGTNNQVFRIRQGSDSHAPYTSTDLGVSLKQLSLYTEFSTPENDPNILGINKEGKLSLCKFHDGQYTQQTFQPANATQTIERFLSTRSATGKIFANVIFEEGAGAGQYLLGTNFFDPATLKWAADHWATVQGPDGKDANVKDIAICSNSLLQQSLFAIGSNDRVWYSQGNFSSGASKMVDLGKLFVRSISVAVDGTSDALLHIFATERDTGALWVKRQKKYLVDGKVQWEDWVKIPSITNAPLGRVYATLNYQNLLEVFAIAEDGRLYQTRQNTSGKNTVTWSPLFPLGNQIGNSVFNVAQNAAGYPEVFTVTHDNQLKRFWQSSETTQWFSEPIRVDNPAQEVAQVPTHSLHLTILNPNGIAQPNTEVTIATPSLTSLQINGLSYQSSPTQKIKVKTDYSGRLSILQRADRLAAASVLIETPFTSLGQPVQVEPNAQLQEEIYKVTPERILNAKDKSGNYLLPEDKRNIENATSMANIMRQSMQLGLADKNSGKALYHFASKGNRTGWDGKLDPAQVQEQHWEIDFQSGFPQYRQLNATMVGNYLATVSPGQPEGFWDDFKNFWGNAWNAIKEGVGFLIDGLKRIVVTTIIDPISGLVSKVKVFFEMLVDGITHLVETVIEFVQQAFDFVEGVWNWLKVKLEKVYEWLAFFFDWDDIRRTNKALVFSNNVLLDFAIDAMTYSRNGVDNWFKETKGKLKTSVDDYLNGLNANDKLDNIGKQYQKPAPEEEHAMDHNILFNAFKENLHAAKTPNKADYAARYADSPIQGIYDKLKELADNFEFGDGKQAFQEAIDYFGNIKENPDNAMKLLLSGLIKLGETIALFGLDLAKGVVLSIIDLVKDVVEAFKELINEEWEIPIVSAIYKYITGSTLSFKPIELFSYIIAIPATLIYKIAYKTAPFPDDQAVQDFENTYSLQWLENRAGITPSASNNQQRGYPTSVETANVEGGTSKIGPAIFNIAFYFTIYAKFFVESLTAINSAFTTDPTQADSGDAQKLAKTFPLLPTISIILNTLAMVFTNPWITEGEVPKTWCNMIFGWVASLLNLLRGIVMAVVIYIRGATTIVVNVQEITQTIFGSIGLILNVVGFILATNRNAIAFARNLNMFMPITLRFLALPSLNKSFEAVPVGILVVLIFVFYTAAFGLNFFNES